MTSRSIRTSTVLLSVAALLVASGPSGAITAELARKCSALMAKEFSPRNPGNPAAGAPRAAGRHSRCGQQRESRREGRQVMPIARRSSTGWCWLWNISLLRHAVPEIGLSVAAHLYGARSFVRMCDISITHALLGDCSARSGMDRLDGKNQQGQRQDRQRSQCDSHHGTIPPPDGKLLAFQTMPLIRNRTFPERYR